jgi:hypothetical protein
MEIVEKTIPYHGSIRPPYPQMSTFVQNASFGTKLVKVFYALIAGFVFFIIPFAIGHAKEIKWLEYTGEGLGLLVFIFSALEGLKAQVAPCPYCNNALGKTSGVLLSKTNDNSQVECPKCFEWLVSNMGEIRPFKEQDFKDETEFKSPVFQNSVWPNECITCGNPATKYLEAKNTSLSVGKLLVGRISVAWGTVKNVPYCDAHEEMVKLKVDSDEMFVVFKDYAARRRYLAVNPQRLPYKK